MELVPILPAILTFGLAFLSDAGLGALLPPAGQGAVAQNRRDWTYTCRR